MRGAALVGMGGLLVGEGGPRRPAGPTYLVGTGDSSIDDITTGSHSVTV